MGHNKASTGTNSENETRVNKVVSIVERGSGDENIRRESNKGQPKSILKSKRVELTTSY